VADSSFWHKQTPDKPLYADMLWSRPENKKARGKLLVVGGHSHAFTAPARAYAESVSAGVGLTRVVLPRHVKRLLPSTFSEMEFAPSTPSGSFARQALAELLDAASWADGVLLAGDFGRNSETAIVLEQFIQKYTGQLTLSQDSIDYFVSSEQLCARPNTLVAPSFSQLQKLATAAHLKTAVTSSLDFLHFIDALRDFTRHCPLSIAINHNQTTFVAVNGQVSSTKPQSGKDEAALAAHAAVWWLQNPGKPFEAISTSIM
jgi:hypothetical protein